MDATLHDEIAELTSDLIGFESIAERPDQLHGVIDYAAAYLERIPGIQLSRHERAGKPSLVATLHPTREPTIFFNAHLDVVPARTGQFAPQQQDARLYGRGSQDMKGSAAVLLRLIKTLAADPASPDVGLQLVADEEIGGANGAGYLLELGYRCRFFLAAEPTDLRICHQSKGVLWIEVVVPGDPAHGSMPWDGQNAILALRDGLVRLEERFPTPSSPAWRTTVTPTTVEGGSARNRLPEQVLLRLDCRRIPEDSVEAIVAAVGECFPGAKVGVGGSGPPLLTSPDDPFVQRLAAVAAQQLGQPAQLYGEHFATDARYYSHVGIPAICFGPIGKGLHSDEEWVDLPSLVQLYQILHDFVQAVPTKKEER